MIKRSRRKLRSLNHYYTYRYIIIIYSDICEHLELFKRPVGLSWHMCVCAIEAERGGRPARISIALFPFIADGTRRTRVVDLLEPVNCWFDDMSTRYVLTIVTFHTSVPQILVVIFQKVCTRLPSIHTRHAAASYLLVICTFPDVWV